jgi:hypothetical protein
MSYRQMFEAGLARGRTFDWPGSRAALAGALERGVDPL